MTPFTIVQEPSIIDTLQRTVDTAMETMRRARIEIEQLRAENADLRRKLKAQKDARYSTERNQYP